jgi:hypothetical protein
MEQEVAEEPYILRQLQVTAKLNSSEGHQWGLPTPPTCHPLPAASLVGSPPRLPESLL